MRKAMPPVLHHVVEYQQQEHARDHRYIGQRVLVIGEEVQAECAGGCNDKGLRDQQQYYRAGRFDNTIAWHLRRFVEKAGKDDKENRQSALRITLTIHNMSSPGSHIEALGGTLVRQAAAKKQISEQENVLNGSVGMDVIVAAGLHGFVAFLVAPIVDAQVLVDGA